MGHLACSDCETFDILGRWEIDRGPQNLHYDFWWTRRWRDAMNGSTALVAVSTMCALWRCSSISVVMVIPASAGADTGPPTIRAAKVPGKNSPLAAARNATCRCVDNRQPALAY